MCLVAHVVMVWNVVRRHVQLIYRIVLSCSVIYPYLMYHGVVG